MAARAQKGASGKREACKYGRQPPHHRADLFRQFGPVGGQRQPRQTGKGFRHGLVDGHAALGLGPRPQRHQKADADERDHNSQQGQ